MKSHVRVHMGNASLWALKRLWHEGHKLEVNLKLHSRTFSQKSICNHMNIYQYQTH